MPIYYVIYTTEQAYNFLLVFRILKVIECNIEDIDKVYKSDFLPLLNVNRNIQTMFIYREPDNPFRYISDNTTL